MGTGTVTLDDTAVDGDADTDADADTDTDSDADSDPAAYDGTYLGYYAVEFYFDAWGWGDDCSTKADEGESEGAVDDGQIAAYGGCLFDWEDGEELWMETVLEGSVSGDGTATAEAWTYADDREGEGEGGGSFDGSEGTLRGEGRLEIWGETMAYSWTMELERED